MGAVVNAFHNRAPARDHRPATRTAATWNSSRTCSPACDRADGAVRQVSAASRRAPRTCPRRIDRAWALAQTPPVWPGVRVGAERTTGTRRPRSGNVRRSGVDACRRRSGCRRGRGRWPAGRAREPGRAGDRGAGVDRTARGTSSSSWPSGSAPRCGRRRRRRGWASRRTTRCTRATSRRATPAPRRSLTACELALVLGAPVFAFLPYEPGAVSLPGRSCRSPTTPTRPPGRRQLSVVGDVRRGRAAPARADWRRAATAGRRAAATPRRARRRRRPAGRSRRRS